MRSKTHKYSDFTWSPCGFFFSPAQVCIIKSRAALPKIALRRPFNCLHESLENIEVVSRTTHQQHVFVAVLAAFLPSRSVCLFYSSSQFWFPNTSWFMMSHPKIPSQTPIRVKPQMSNKLFPAVSPSFALTGVCLPWRQWDWRGLTSAPLTGSQCQEAVRWKNSEKARVPWRLAAVLPTASPSPLSCVYANSVCRKRTRRMTHC